MRQNILWPRSNAGAAAVTLAMCLGLILILDIGLDCIDPLHGVTGIDHVFGLTYRLIARDAG